MRGGRIRDGDGKGECSSACSMSIVDARSAVSRSCSAKDGCRLATSEKVVKSDSEPKMKKIMIHADRC